MQLFEIVVGGIVNLIIHFNSKEIAFAFAFAILGVGFIIWVLCVLRHHLFLVRSLKKATLAIRSASSNADWSAEDRLAAVDKAIKDNAVLAEAWNPYRAALRPDPNRQGCYVNSVDPLGWFAINRLPGHGYEKWATTMAGVSLTVGLLFTFVALSAALFKVGEAGADTAQLRLAIAEILRISSAKFITSMAGIVAYILWTLVARSNASTQSRLTARFASAVQSLSAPATPESLLLDQLDEARAQTNRLKTLSDDMAVAFDSCLNKVLGQRLDALPSAVGEALQPALERSVRPVVEAMQGMGRSIGQGNHAALEGMITGLMSGVKDATSRELGMLVDAMREAAGELKVAKSGIGESGAEFGQVLARAAEGMNGSATRIADAMESRVGEIDARMQRMDDVLSSGAARFDSMGGAMSEQMADGLRKAMECIAAAATSGAETAREHAQAGLAPVLSELKGLIGEIRNSAEDSRSALVAGGRSAADDLGAALSKVGDDLTGASARASTVLVESFQESTARMVGAIDGAVAGYMTTTQTLAARLATVEQGFDLLDQSVRRNVGQMVEVGGAMTSAGQAFGTASDQLRQAAAPVLSTLQTVEGAATSARDALRLVQETGAAMREAATAMAATSQAAVKAFESYEQRFAGVDAGLGQTVAKLKDGVIELGSQVTAVVVEYDKHLASALGSLRTGVQEIAEAVDGLGDKLAEAA